MAEFKNTDFDRPGGYAMPTGATAVQRRSARELAEADIRLYGDGAVERLMSSKVAVFGLGGVGSFAAESLARSAIGHLTLVDFDDVCVTNANRQLQALRGNIGKPKAEVLSERLRESLDTLENVEVVGSVADETAAVAAVLDKRPDVVILDLQLKEGTGFGVMQRLGETRPIIIVFTNYMLPEYPRIASSLGVQHFLNNSVDYERLPVVLQEIGAARHN
jgi:CheY-like chemotaxis protein